MALKIADRVQEVTTTTGTGTLNLAGAATQMQSFITAIGTGNTTYYCIKAGNGSDWEVGLGTVTSGTPNTLSRDSIFASSNANAAVNLTGTSTVFVVNPANHAITSLDLDNGFSATRGQILYRGAAGWTVLAPGTSGQVLTTNGAGADPSWTTSSGTGTGLFNQVMSATPTSAGTGLTTWVNQNSSTVTDAATGITIAQSGSGISLRTKAVPATPYSFKVLLANDTLVGTASNPSAFFGWYDGTNKIHAINLFWLSSGTSLTMTIERWTSPTVFSSSADFGRTGVFPNPIWLRIRDDGTTGFFQFCASGNDADFQTIFSTTKSTSFLGAAGFANIFFGCAHTANAGLTTLLSFSQGV